MAKNGTSGEMVKTVVAAVVILFLGLGVGGYVGATIIIPKMMDMGLFFSTKTYNEHEPNETFDTATPLKVGYETNGLLTNKDVDTFSFYLAEAARINIVVKNLPQSFSTNIFNSKHELIASSVRTGFDEGSSILTLPSGGMYYIQLKPGPTSFMQTPYTLLVNVLSLDQ